MTSDSTREASTVPPLLLRGFYSMATGGISLQGNIRGLQWLERLFRGESGTSVRVVLHEDPGAAVLDELPLSQVHVAITEREKVLISLWESELRIRGASEPMRFLAHQIASIIQAAAAGPSGRLRPHYHVGWLPEDDDIYLDPQSLSLIIGAV